MNVKNFKVFISCILVFCMFFVMTGCVPKEYEVPDATGYNYNDGLIALDYDEDHFEVNEWFNFGDDVCVSSVMEKAEKFVVSASQIELLHISNVEYDEETLEVGVYEIFDTYIGDTKDYDFEDSLIEEVPGCLIYSVNTDSEVDSVSLKAWLHNNTLTVATERIPKDEDMLEIHEYDSELKGIFNNILYLGGTIDSKYLMSFEDEDNEDIVSLDK